MVKEKSQTVKESRARHELKIVRFIQRLITDYQNGDDLIVSKDEENMVNKMEAHALKILGDVV
jgi:hypothetical protein